MTANPNIEAETYVESINELNELISEIEKIDGIEKMETAFIRKYVRERFDWGTPRFFEDNED
ncbi:MAG: hypothetical protein K9L30_17155 [Desulfobacterales bacterium]|nr:hypothetical protein [Desulfobacterales bacterium]